MPTDPGVAVQRSDEVRDLDVAMRVVVERVHADLDGAAPAVSPGRVSLQIDASFAQPDGGVDDRAPRQCVVATVAGHRFAAGFEHGLEIACGTVMSVLQDDVVSVSGRPWPDFVDEHGADVGVLDVVVALGGLAHWALRGRPICAVGLLTGSYRARGWRVCRGDSATPARAPAAGPRSPR